MLCLQDQHSSHFKSLHESSAAADMSKLFSKDGISCSWNRDWDGLQVVHDQNAADGLQAVRDQKSDGLQALYRYSNRGYPGHFPPSQTDSNDKEGTRRTCGLRVTSFWLVCVIVILVVGGGVGGGIGGWLASRKSEYVYKLLLYWCSGGESVPF